MSTHFGVSTHDTSLCRHGIGTGYPCSGPALAAWKCPAGGFGKLSDSADLGLFWTRGPISSIRVKKVYNHHMAKRTTTTAAGVGEGLVLSSGCANAHRAYLRHDAAMLRDETERALAEHRVTSTSSHKRSSKGLKHSTTEATREVRQWGGIDAKQLQLASLDERAKLCVKAFGRALKAREWRNLQKALATENREVIAKLAKGFRNSR